jgi:hypothetical protein
MALADPNYYIVLEQQYNFNKNLIERGTVKEAVAGRQRQDRLPTT